MYTTDVPALRPELLEPGPYSFIVYPATAADRLQLVTTARRAAFASLALALGHRASITLDIEDREFEASQRLSRASVPRIAFPDIPAIHITAGFEFHPFVGRGG
jgi:hypothetical protein